MSQELVATKEGEELKEEQMDEKEQRARRWFQEAAWIYPRNDERFIKLLTENLKKYFGENCTVWKGSNSERKSEYPQYLCSADLRGIGGDTVHLWRDGQTWWPMSGDYSLDEEEMVESILRQTILEFMGKR